MEEKIEILSGKLTELEPKTISALVIDIAKATKKKAITSGNLFYKDFCKVVAKALLTRKNTGVLIQKYNLA